MNRWIFIWFLASSFWLLSGNSQAATIVSPLTNAQGITSFTAGHSYSCAVKNGKAYCWGYNYEGQLGIGNNQETHKIFPTAVVGISGTVTAIAAGDFHTCAIVDGGVMCWGTNTTGRLGSGDYTSSLTPRWVVGLGPHSNVTDISTGRYATCAVQNGGLKCWGSNSFCVLGQKGCKGPENQEGNNNFSSTVPKIVEGLPEGSGVTKVSVNEGHTCAVVRGGAKCWGLHYLGTLGNGIERAYYQDVPVDVSNMPANSGVTDITTGMYHSCAIQNGGALCWGRAIFLGQENHDRRQPALQPEFVDNMGYGSGALAVSSYDRSTCAIHNSLMECFGLAGFGQLADGGQKDPRFIGTVKAKNIFSPIAIEFGYFHGCALDRDGLKCWGDNSDGQVGNGDDGNFNVIPVLVKNL